MPKNDVPEWVTGKIRKYCAFQERCIADVKSKLMEWKVQEHHIDEVIRILLRDNYLNEERYARVFAGGKFRNNKWGKFKIMKALQQKQIPELYIQMGVREIDEQEYRETLRRLISAKKSEIRDSDPVRVELKIMNYTFGKGFEPELVREILNL
ncbi:MAG: RecX family transcriptional regulator [Bacteroidales bacterium]|nr:RecX family transcriptional regulator [Bacteroidales bacterium]